ncbi:exodeoxyribonuclease VII large subunit [Thioclava electrotropha]|uniref:Exodeoxyribonuclease 7 large subunit n=1 Tax=Thioclava electrotropha TaxID=1549850 RepID=A0ABX6YRM6_9RHOB|nr:exodeoxyribonuclease VII large subunit [Thioclava electrotropha]QPZ90471.1 exodeoxyribonuclease VII large subunit [Thioclava electrotropha]
MDLLDDENGSNAHDYTVSEISGAVKRVIEGEFGRVRVRGEVGRVSMPRSGHMYFDLKDDRSVIAAVSWKGQVAKMQVRPEEGMEVIATGRMTTFAGQSKYQLIVDNVEPAGAGALMAMLEARRKALAAEGLFDAGRKKPIPWLPQVIGVVTSPSGAVIRDILHRLADRFPRHVLIWPVAVQGQACAPEVARAVRGFNALAPGGEIPRPDLIIVARGGGSIEDLWGFNEEAVVRAVAESDIPVISAVGHETDTTLVDHAADRRAPTPTAAAEMAVPVRAELAAWLSEAQTRMMRAARGRLDQRGQRLRDLARGLGRPEALTQPARQSFDLWAERLGPALRTLVLRKNTRFAPLAAQISPNLLRRFIRDRSREIDGLSARLAPAPAARMRRATQDHTQLARRLDAARVRMIGDAQRRNRDGAERLAGLETRLDRSLPARLEAQRERLERLDRTRQTLGYTETLKRGYAVVRGPDGVVTSQGVAEKQPGLEIEFADGKLAVIPGGGGSATAPKPKKKKPDPGPSQGSLF